MTPAQRNAKKAMKLHHEEGYSLKEAWRMVRGGKKSNPRKRKNSLSYTPKWYVFSKSLNKPISRWEYKEDAQDDKDERVDFDGVPKSDLLILSKKAVQKRIGSARLVTGKVLNEYLNSFPFRNNSRKRKNFHHNPKRLTKEQKLRRIVKNHQAEKIGGVLVDAFSASLIVQVIDALSPTNKKKYLKEPVDRMADIAFRLMKKNPDYRRPQSMNMPSAPPSKEKPVPRFSRNPHCKPNPRRRKNAGHRGKGLNRNEYWQIIDKTGKPVERYYMQGVYLGNQKQPYFSIFDTKEEMLKERKEISQARSDNRDIDPKSLEMFVEYADGTTREVGSRGGLRNYTNPRKRKNFHHNPERRSNGRYMSKADFDAMFKEEYIPMILQTEMSQGSRYPDRPMRREAYNNAMDSFMKDGQISEDQAFRWSHPAWLETYGFRKALAEKKKQDRYGYSNPRKRKNGTKKGQSRKTARRAYMKNGKSAAQKRAQRNAAKAMKLWKSGEARSLKAAWRMVK